jgi:HSP20 family protein
MDRNSTRNWMWSEACEMLARAERMHHEFFRLAGSISRLPTWEPPADILETESAVLVLVALPGVDPDYIDTIIDDGRLVISGLRALPPELQTATIHRLELPQGRFERRLQLPPGRYAAARRAVINGCLMITLDKL